MSVSVSALSRFHLFQMARQLNKHSVLEELITAYPKFALKKNNDDLVNSAISMPMFAFYREAIIQMNRLNLDTSMLRKLLYSSFSNSTGVRVSQNSNVLVGLSGFMLEAMAELKTSDNHACIVDHGSLHTQTEFDVLSNECRLRGYKPFDNWSHSWMKEKMDKEFLRADHVFCCSTLAKETMINNGVKDDKIFVNPLGVDLNHFYRKPYQSKETFKFLHVSNMNPRKGVHTIIEAFESLKFSDCELWLVGSLPKDKTLLSRINRNKGIRVFGPVPEVKLVDIYNECDVFVHPSLADGWAMTVLQAMACGLPVIVSDMTGSKEVVSPDAGWVIKSNNPSELYDVMRLAYLNDQITHEMGEQAYSDIKEGYTWDDYGIRLNNWLNSANLV